MINIQKAAAEEKGVNADADEGSFVSMLHPYFTRSEPVVEISENFEYSVMQNAATQTDPTDDHIEERVKISEIHIAFLNDKLDQVEEVNRKLIFDKENTLRPPIINTELKASNDESQLCDKMKSYERHIEYLNEKLDAAEETIRDLKEFRRQHRCSLNPSSESVDVERGNYSNLIVNVANSSVVPES